MLIQSNSTPPTPCACLRLLPKHQLESSSSSPGTLTETQQSLDAIQVFFLADAVALPLPSLVSSRTSTLAHEPCDFVVVVFFLFGVPPPSETAAATLCGADTSPQRSVRDRPSSSDGGGRNRRRGSHALNEAKVSLGTPIFLVGISSGELKGGCLLELGGFV